MNLWLRRALRVLAGVALGLACVEILLRIFTPQPLNILYVRPDGVLSHVPGIDVDLITVERRARVRINRDGLRDVERPRRKPPGVSRVLVLGDSMIEGLQVELPETMPKQMEKRLRAALPGRRIDVINAGVSGSSGPYALRYLQKDGLAYAPDVVVMTFTARNDIEEAATAFEKKRPPLYALRVFLRARLHLYASVERTLNTEDWLRNAIAFFGLVQPADPTRARTGTPGAVNMEAWHYDGRLEEQEDRGYDRLFASWNEILSLCRARGIPVVFVLLPTYFQVTRDPSVLGEPSRVTVLVRNDREPQDRALAFLEHQGVPVVDLLPGARSRGATLYLPKDQHFSAAGNAFAAEETTRAILRLGLF